MRLGIARTILLMLLSIILIGALEAARGPPPPPETEADIAMRRITRAYNESDIALSALYQLLEDTDKAVISYQGDFRGLFESVQKMLDSYMKEGQPAPRKIREHACHCQAAVNILFHISKRYATLNSVDRLAMKLGFKKMRLPTEKVQKFREEDKNGIAEATYFHIWHRILSLGKYRSCGFTMEYRVIDDALKSGNPSQFLIHYCSDFNPNLEVCRNPPDPMKL